MGKKWLNRYAAASLVYCGVLFWLSSNSNPVQPPHWFQHEDKVIHAGLYAVLALLVAGWVNRGGFSWPSWLKLAFPVLFALTYGISDEFHQWFVPNRTPDVLDVVADFAGALVAQSAYIIWHGRSRPASD